MNTSEETLVGQQSSTFQQDIIGQPGNTDFMDTPSILCVAIPPLPGIKPKGTLLSWYQLTAEGNISKLDGKPDEENMIFKLIVSRKGEWEGVALSGFWHHNRMDSRQVDFRYPNTLRMMTGGRASSKVEGRYNTEANLTAFGGFPIPIEIAGYHLHFGRDFSLSTSNINNNNPETPRICFEFRSQGKEHCLTIQSLQHKHTFRTPLSGKIELDIDLEGGILQDEGKRVTRLLRAHQAEGQANEKKGSYAKTQPSLALSTDAVPQSPESNAEVWTPTTMDEAADFWLQDGELSPETAVNSVLPSRAGSPANANESSRATTSALPIRFQDGQYRAAIFEIAGSVAAEQPEAPQEWQDLFTMGGGTFIINVDDKRYLFSAQTMDLTYEGGKIKVDPRSPSAITLHTKSKFSGFSLGNGHRYAAKTNEGGTWLEKGNGLQAPTTKGRLSPRRSLTAPTINFPRQPATLYTIQGIPVHTGPDSELDFVSHHRPYKSTIAISFDHENQMTVIGMPEGAELKMSHGGDETSLVIPPRW